jgi:hypothetical protein
LDAPRKSFRDSFAEWLELVALVAAIAWFALGMLVPSVGLVEWLSVFLVVVCANLLAAWLSPDRARLYALLWRRHATPLRGYEAKELPSRPPKS